ncbi:MAG: aminopeptidase P family protein [Leptothrix ochracea]|uniref:aminopeptidase P family protein n=1 Tax=Leptothrix ochracea TaxID=735331 RepID=UPI0034E2E4F2
MTSSHTRPTTAWLLRLRQALSEQGLDALMIPSADPHLSEYLPLRWQGREHVSGFTGSAGTLLISAEHAALLTDSRYWTQAEAELAGSGIDLVRQSGALVPACVAWLQTQQRASGATLAVDGMVLGLASAEALRSALAAVGMTLRTDVDVLGSVWPDRPALPAAAVFEHMPPHASTPRTAKLAAIRADIVKHGATHHFISTVDDIAWLTNLRSSDVDYNPVFLAHLLIDAQRATLFVAEGKVPPEIAQRLAQDQIELRPYDAARAALAALKAEDRLLIDPKRITLGLRQAVAAGVTVIEALNPCVLHKSRKTDAEAACVREAMERDGAAMCTFYAWFEAALGRETISELTVDERLSAERARQPDFVSLSFPTIAGFNANGAMPHYRATPASHAQISTAHGLVAEGLLLIDSGAQYLGGTTDITRVWPIGTPSAAQKADYTRVLQGTLALSRARFPQGLLSPRLDALARAPLWQAGLDFGHGTGHGVGYFLNVHEGPQSISAAQPEPHMAMQPGMITSIEPALYRPGRWGVRIENLVLNVPSPSAEEFGPFLAFETLTLCPIDTRCIALDLLHPHERQQLNAYHADVLRRLRPHLSGAARAWLEARTQPISLL